MTDLPRRLRLPPLDTPLLEWWADDYDHVFIAYSPFFRVPGYTPETAAYGPVYTNATDADDILDLIHNPPERANEAPPDFETKIKETGEAVLWADVHSAVGFGDFETFARTTWLWTVNTRREDRNEQVLKGLSRLVRESALYSPQEDYMPVILEPIIAEFLAAIGVESVTLHDEFDTETCVSPSRNFARGKAPVYLPKAAVSKISSEDPRLLMAWSHDDVAAFICITDELRRMCPPEQFFEGTYATSETYSDWLNPPEMFARKPQSKPQ